MIGQQIITREYNNYSDELRSKLRVLEPGEVVKVKLHDSHWASVTETRFATMDSNSPIPGTANIVRKKIGTYYLGTGPWTVMDGTKMIQVGFLETIDFNGKPQWRQRAFVDGEHFFYGDSMADIQDFMALQLHPEMKKENQTGVYKFYIDNPEETSDNSLKKITWRTVIQNAVLGVTDEQLKRLSTAQIYGRAMFNKPTHSGAKAMRGYIAGLLTNDNGYTMVERIFRNLKEVEDIDLIIKALSTGKLILSETNLKRNDNHLLGSFTSPIIGGTEEKAIEIYAMFKSNPEWNEDILEWLREDASKTPSGVRKSKATITMDNNLD
jgi:TusA-related sulfurtransferase